MSSLRPLGHRLLIRPDTPPAASEAGLILPENRDHVPVSGTVFAIGTGPARDQKIRRASIARCISILDELIGMGVRDPVDYRAALDRYRFDQELFDGSIQVGDRVVYPEETGLSVTEDGDTFIVMAEDDVVILVADEEEAA